MSLKRGGASGARRMSESIGTTRLVGAGSAKSRKSPARRKGAKQRHEQVRCLLVVFASLRLCGKLSLGITDVLGTDLHIREARTAGSIQGLGAGYRLGCADARRDDCDLHVYLRGHFWRAFRRERFTLGLRVVSLLRSLTLDHVSGVGATVCQHDHHSCEPRQTCRVPARDVTGGAGFCGTRQPIVRDCWPSDRDARDPAGIASDDTVAAAAFDPAVIVRARRGVANCFTRRVSAGHRAGDYVAANGVDVSDADHLSRVDHPRSFSSTDRYQSVYSPRAELPPDLSRRRSA